MSITGEDRENVHSHTKGRQIPPSSYTIVCACSKTRVQFTSRDVNDALRRRICDRVQVLVQVGRAAAAGAAVGRPTRRPAHSSRLVADGRLRFWHRPYTARLRDVLVKWTGVFRVRQLIHTIDVKKRFFILVTFLTFFNVFFIFQTFFYF